MNQREALKLSLEVMRNQGDVSVDEWIATEKAIKEALAQPEQSQVEETLRYEIDALETKLAECRAQQPEPVIDKSAAVRIATALGWEPKRTWRWLTDEEIYEAWDTIIEEPKQAIQFVYNIQAKLKEKNT